MSNPEMIRGIERAVVLASYLYYDGPSDVESPWNDADFDARVHFLAFWEKLRSPEFAARLKAAKIKLTERTSSLHGLVYTAEEKAAAIAWAKSGQHWP